MKMLTVMSVAIVTLLGGCSIQPVQIAGTPEALCKSFSTELRLDPDQTVKAMTTATADPFDAMVQSAYTRSATAGLQPMLAPTTRAAAEPVSNSVLVLSGGSQNGAFGAGYLDRWAQLRSGGRGLPRFRIVTGISTGALQSTFAFLDQAEVNRAGYMITREDELLERWSRGSLKEQPFSAGRAIATKGALAALNPLRRKIRELISPGVLHAVAAQAGTDEAGTRRHLLVGTVEMDTGELRVFDMTEIAKRYAAAPEAAQQEREALKDCYVEVLIASSSVPAAAPPNFIDGDMYIDGGARFGVFIERLDQALAKVALPSASDPGVTRALSQPTMYIIVNSQLRADPKCNLGDDLTPCQRESQTAQSPQHAKWSFVSLATRSVSILIDQSYRGAVFWAQQSAMRAKFKPVLVKIEPAAFDHEAKVDLQPEAGMTKRCSAWKADDQKFDQPLEFHPRFMHCLVDFGANQAEASGWATYE